MTKPKEPPKTQKQRFKEAAREHECDESEKAFEKSLERLVPPKRGNNGNEEDDLEKSGGISLS